MEEINIDGKVSIKNNIEEPLNTAVNLLQQKHKSAFDDIHPMIQLIYKTLSDIKSWKTIDSK